MGLDRSQYEGGNGDDTRGYVARNHAPAAHVAAVVTADREGPKRVVSPNSHRHIMLRYYSQIVRSTLIDAGVHAHDHLGVGKRTITGWDTGRRRASELAEFKLLDQEIGIDDGHAYYRINELGREVLAIVDSGKRWQG